MWGLTHELSTKDDEGKRHLTRAGRYSIAFVIVGLLMSLNTTALESINKARTDDQARQEKQQAEQSQALKDLTQQQQAEAVEQRRREDSKAILDTAQQASIESSLREQRDTKRAIQQHTTMLKEVSRLLQPINDVKVEAAVLIPRHRWYSSYLQRLDEAVVDYMANPKGSSVSSGIYSQDAFRKGRFIPEVIRIPPASTAYPQLNRECEASHLVTEPQITIYLRKRPFDLRRLKLPGFELYRESDLQLITTGTARLLEYEPNTKRIAAILDLRATVDQESWDSNAKVTSVADLPGSQMFLSVGERGLCASSMPVAQIELPEYDLVQFVMRIGRRQFSIDMKYFERVRDKNRMNYYVITFPDSDELFRRLSESAENLSWYSKR